MIAGDRATPRKVSPKHYLRRIREEEKPLRFLASRLLWRSRVCLSLRTHIRLPEGGVIRFHPAAMSANLWVDPNRYDHATHFLRRYLRAGDRFVDVGANIGLHSVIAASMVGVSGRVVSVEPHPRTFGYLAENVRLNGYDWVSCHNVAAAARTGRAFMTSLKSDDQNSLLADEEGKQVTLVDLDTLLSSDEHIDLLKVDVDGFETEVFRGASSVLKRTSCVYFEAAHGYAERYGYSLRDVFESLGSSGFEIYQVDVHRGTLARLDQPFEGIREDLVATRNPKDVIFRISVGQTVRSGPND